MSQFNLHSPWEPAGDQPQAILELTEGIEKLDIKIEFIPEKRDLYPGHPYPAEPAWSEARYWVYCYKMPKVTFK